MTSHSRACHRFSHNFHFPLNSDFCVESPPPRHSSLRDALRAKVEGKGPSLALFPLPRSTVTPNEFGSALSSLICSQRRIRKEANDEKGERETSAMSPVTTVEKIALFHRSPFSTFRSLHSRNVFFASRPCIASDLPPLPTTQNAPRIKPRAATRRHTCCPRQDRSFDCRRNNKKLPQPYHMPCMPRFVFTTNCTA